MTNAYIMIQSCIGLFALLIFWYWFWKDYVVDRFRQDIFTLRNNLFLATANGEAPFGFDSPEYKKTVEILNISIRCVENFNICRMIWLFLLKAVLAPGRSFESLEQNGQLISASDSEESKKYLDDIQRNHGLLTMRYLATISPTFLLIMGILLVVAIAVTIPRALDQSLTRITAILEAKLKSNLRDYGTIVGGLTEMSAVYNTGQGSRMTHA